MFREILFILSFPIFMSANKVCWQVDMEFKWFDKPINQKCSIVLNGQSIKCHCGKQPVCLLFYYGIPTAYCSKHTPLQFEKNEYEPEIDFDKLLATSEGWENG